MEKSLENNAELKARLDASGFTKKNQTEPVVTQLMKGFGDVSFRIDENAKPELACIVWQGEKQGVGASIEEALVNLYLEVKKK